MDDPRFAAAILAWLVVTGGGLPWLGVPKGLLPIVVVIGLVGILMASIIRRARS